MRHLFHHCLRSIVCILIATLAAPLSAQPSQPCEQIVRACRSAGFIFGDYKEGNGLWVDCLSPIMDGTDQPPTAKIALPELSAEVVAACKATGPNFGQGKEPSPKGAPPDQPSGK
jgi:hypothetical protein